MKISVLFSKIMSNKGVLFNVYLLIAIVTLFSLIIISATARQDSHQKQVDTRIREYYLTSSENLVKIIEQLSLSQYWFKLDDRYKTEYTSAPTALYAGEKEIINNLLYEVNSRSEIISELQKVYHEEIFERTFQRFITNIFEFEAKIQAFVENINITPEAFDVALDPLIQVSRQLYRLHLGAYSEGRKKLQSSSEKNATTTILLISALMLAGFIVVARILGQIRNTLRVQKKTEEDIRHLNLVLEDRVEQRTQELKNSLDELHLAQDKLVESEKMAALGGLVAGIAHEINTPLGVCMTANSFLLQKIKDYTGQYDVTSLTRKDFESLIATADESTSFIQTNLQRASRLIRSFKQIAVDRSNDEIRKIQLCSYLSEIILSLEPEIKKLRPDITINCDEYLQLTSHPGAIAQIITNLIMNSLIHGFEDMDGLKPGIEINVTSENQSTHLLYSDNGKGVTADQKKKIFDPFYTTRRNQGGTGLGMHIVYNLVSQTLDGSIDCQSAPGEGIEFHITIPLRG